MPTLYILIGPPGSGKSTWARQNAERLNAVVVGSDAVRRDFRADGQNPFNGDKVFAEVERRAREQLQAKRNVILDATHYLRKYRNYALHLANDFHVRRVAIWFDVPMEVCMQRNAQRHAPRVQQTFGDEEIPDETVRQIHARLQPPRPDEFDEVIRLHD